MSGFADIELAETVAAGVMRGDRQAQANAYRQLARAVMNMSARILQDRQLAEEVVQDTFIDLVEKGSQIQRREAVVPWVRRVAVNHCLMRLRSPWHARRDEMEAEYMDRDVQPDADLEWMAQIPSLERALSVLSEEARTVVWLHDVEGYTHKEIGEAMGKTASFSKSQLARAYEKLLAWREQRAALDREVLGAGGHLVDRQETDKRTKEGQNAKKTLGNIGSPCGS